MLRGGREGKRDRCGEERKRRTDSKRCGEERKRVRGVVRRRREGKRVKRRGRGGVN